jgi:hypothetical protein
MDFRLGERSLDVGIGVEPAGRPVVARVVEQRDDENGIRQTNRAEAKVLVVAPDPLGVLIDVEELTRPQDAWALASLSRSTNRLLGGQSPSTLCARRRGSYAPNQGRSQ